MQIKIDGKTLLIENQEIYNFPIEIKKFIDFNNIIAICLKRGFIKENIFGIDPNGRLIWQIEEQKSPFFKSSYIDIKKINNQLEIVNWDGEHFLVDPINGKIISKISHINKRPW